VTGLGGLPVRHHLGECAVGTALHGRGRNC
jgi:hypothetical protein